MAVGNQPISPSQLNASPVALTATINTALDGTGTITTVMTAGVNGARVDKIILKAAGTTTAGMLRIFVKIAAGTYRLIDEVAVTAIVPAATTQSFSAIWTPTSGTLELSPNCVLGISTEKAENFNAMPVAGDY